MLLKKIAQKIMKPKIDELQKEIDDLQKMRNHEFELYTTTENESMELLKKQTKMIEDLKDKIKDLQYQNDILRQYYHLDEEPSEEIQAKIRIDMRCHDLERELDHQRIIADLAGKSILATQSQIANLQTMMMMPMRYF